MVWLKKLRAAVGAFVTFPPFKDCSRGNIYERSAAYRFNYNHKHILLERSVQATTAALMFYGLGMLTEMHQLLWLCAPSYIAVALCFVQVPIFLFGYAYLSRWPYWNNGGQ